MKDSVICKDVFGNEYEVPVTDLDIRIGVYAVLIKDNKILLARQWDGYSIIGGGVEKGETLEDALIREIKEETGLDATPGKLIYHATTYFKRDKSSQARQSYQFYFIHDSLEGDIQNTGITESEKTYTDDMPEWVEINRINEINFRHSVDLNTIIAAYKDWK